MSTTLFAADANAGISPTVACKGDSLMAGAGGTPLSTLLSNVFPDRLFLNYGIGGQTAQQIAARQGGNPIYLTITGNAFSGTNPISVTNISVQAISTPADNVTRYLSGTIQGIPAILTRTATGTYPSQVETYTLTPCFSSVASIPAGSVFIPDDAYNNQNHMQILWMGRNNGTALSGTVDVLIDACIAQLKRPRRFLLIGDLPALNEPSGSAIYTAITAFNSALAAAYPANYVSVSAPTVAEMAALNFTPSTQDNTDIANDLIPTAMRSDNIHLTTVGYQLIANRLAQRIQSFGW